MRRLTLYAVLLLAVASCTKSDSPNKGKFFSSDITGRWTYAEYYYSIGGPLIYEPAQPANQWLLFKEDGSLTSNMDLFKDIHTYEVQDSATVRFFTPAAPSGYLTYYYDVDALANMLSMGSLDHICIEGCGIRFKRK